MTDHTHTQPGRPERLEFHHPIAVVRGLLAAAASRVEPRGDVEMEIFAAWLHLDEPGRAPQEVVHRPQGDNTAEVILGRARHLLHASLLTLSTEAGLDPLIGAMIHIDAALVYLRAEEPTHPVAAS